MFCLFCFFTHAALFLLLGSPAIFINSALSASFSFLVLGFAVLTTFFSAAFSASFLAFFISLFFSLFNSEISDLYSSIRFAASSFKSTISYFNSSSSSALASLDFLLFLTLAIFCLTSSISSFKLDFTLLISVSVSSIPISMSIISSL